MDVDLEWETEPGEIAARFRDLERALDRRMGDAADDAGARLRGAAQTRAPVDTGRLQSSIEEAVERIGRAVVRVALGTNVHYAPHQEFGTKFMEAQPFLRPALDAEIDWIIDRFETAIANAMADVGLGRA